MATTAEASARTAATDSLQELPAIPSDVGIVRVAAGENHTCVLRGDGQIECWGEANDQEQLDYPEDLRFQEITSGWRFSCGIQTNGMISCWGRNNHRQTDPPEGTFQAVDAGWDHACGLSGTTAVCWGRNANERATPPTDVEFTAIGAGAEHSCGLTAAGDLVCWGKNDNGRADSRSGPFEALTVGIAHTCVLDSNGRASCQGNNSAGQSEPPETSFVEISAGADHTCGTLATGHLECWGASPGGSPNLAFAPAGRFTTISLGWKSGCGINLADQVVCWTSGHVIRPPDRYGRLAMTLVTPRSLFSNPTEILPWPTGGLAVAEKAGSIAIITRELIITQKLNLTDIVDSDGGEKGLLSAAIDPQFNDRRFIYLYYTLHVGSDPDSQIARLSRFSVTNESISRDSELVILDIHRSTNADIHWGGSIRFGPDGLLYLGIGDAACEDCPQDLTSLHGKIIRIDVRDANVDQPYRIPNDNPYSGIPDVRPEIWAIGVRNPWRMSFDSKDGSLWVGDVGDRFEEEVSVVSRGANLGWPMLEGSICRNVDDYVKLNYYALEEGTIYDDQCIDLEHLNNPIISYTTRRTGNCAIIGGLVYRGTAIPWLSGTYIFGDFCSGRIWALHEDHTRNHNKVLIVELDGLITSFGMDGEKELLVSMVGGQIYRLVEADGGFSSSVTHFPLSTTVTIPRYTSSP